MLRKRFAKGAFAVATAMAMVVLPQAQAFATVYGPYYLVDFNSQKCIDNPKSNPDNNVTMTIYTCLYGDNQLWRNDNTPGTNKWWIRNVASNKCLAVKNNSMDDNAPVLQFDCNLGTNEVWYYDYQNWSAYIDAPGVPSQQEARAYKIRNVRSNKCLTVKNTGTANGATLLQFDCSKAGSNIWMQGET